MNTVEQEAARLDRKIGARLRYARKARGMTQAALATKIGVSFQQVQKYELGVNRISTSSVIQIARILEISPLDLLGSEAQEGQPDDWDLVGVDGAGALLRAYKEITAPQLRYVVRELARSLTDRDEP